MAQTPRDIANMAEGMVITMPQRILTLLLQTATRQPSADEASGDGAEFVAEARDFLANDFLPQFEAAAGRPAADALRAAHTPLVKAITQIKDAMPQALSDGASPALSKLGDAASGTLSPAVSRFLGGLFDDVVAFEKESAKRMKDVDSTALAQIDDLSRTINFIAINASVEASRAGDAGKGFAVIATQIRELSQKSKDAVDRLREEFS